MRTTKIILAIFMMIALVPSLTIAWSGPELEVGETTVTTIRVHDIAHNPVTTVTVGTTVHPAANVSDGGITPTGTVVFKYWDNGQCSGTPIATSAPTPLSVGQAEGTAFSQTPQTPGDYGFSGEYSGSANHQPSSGCAGFFVIIEPLDQAMYALFWIVILALAIMGFAVSPWFHIIAGIATTFLTFVVFNGTGDPVLATFHAAVAIGFFLLGAFRKHYVGERELY